MQIDPLEISQELDLEQFETFLHKQGYDVFYQNTAGDSFNASGVAFTINTPGYNAMLSRDVWVEYNIELVDTVDSATQSNFEDPALGIGPLTDIRMALRGGNVIARSMKDLYVTLNGHRFYYNPAYYMDVMNRIFVGPLQSKHEFSGSGGIFDSGNHGNRTDHILSRELTANGNAFPQNWVGNVLDAAVTGNTHFCFYVHNGFHSAGAIGNGPLVDVLCNMRPEYPLKEVWYNPGFSERFDQFSINTRIYWNSPSQQVTNANPGFQWNGGFNPVDILKPIFQLQLFERIPCPLFKMYSTDGVKGSLGHVQSIQLHAQFVDKMLQHVLRCNDPAPTIKLLWQYVTAASCIVHTKWYIPKVKLPRILHFKMPKYLTQNFPLTFTTNQNASTTPYLDTAFYYEKVNLPAIPDALILFVKYDPAYMTCDTPDDYNCELVNFEFAYNASSSKLLGIQTIQMYNHWKRNLQFQSEDVTTYHEWRKYCCVCIVKPEDYGIKGPDELNEPCQFRFRGIARNWYNNPSVFLTPFEPLGGAGGIGSTGMFVVHAIYYRNHVTLAEGNVCKEILPKLQDTPKPQ